MTEQERFKELMDFFNGYAARDFQERLVELVESEMERMGNDAFIHRTEYTAILMRALDEEMEKIRQDFSKQRIDPACFLIMQRLCFKPMYDNVLPHENIMEMRWRLECMEARRIVRNSAA
jgi:hypothetical protein